MLDHSIDLYRSIRRVGTIIIIQVYDVIDAALCTMLGGCMHDAEWEHRLPNLKISDTD